MRGSNDQEQQGPVRAVVQDVVPKGRHGPYAVATDPTGGTQGRITFFLREPVWEENGRPNPGEHVILGDIRKKNIKTKDGKWSTGWRAHKARFVRPSDDQQSQQ